MRVRSIAFKSILVCTSVVTLSFSGQFQENNSFVENEIEIDNNEDSNWCAIELHQSMKNKVECFDLKYNYYSYLDSIFTPGYRKNHYNQITMHHSVGMLVCSHDGIYCTNAFIYNIQCGGPLYIHVNTVNIYALGIQCKYEGCDSAYNHALIIDYFMYHFFRSFSEASS